MNEWILKGYEFFSAGIPFLIAFFAIRLRNRQQGIATSKGHTLLVFAFAFYICGVFYFTGAGTLYDILRLGIDLRSNQINLIPFSQKIHNMSHLLNIVLFVPFGFLLPPLSPPNGKLPVIAVSGLAFSLLIELSQLLNHRTTDVDDLITNTLGAVLGYLLFRLFARITKWPKAPLGAARYEPFLYIGVMFLGRFLLYNEFGAAKMLYGF